jgi:Nucleic-acid-binding protein possibly involved in ribosomal biogenesis
MKILEEAVEDARQIQDAATRIAQERLVEALNPRLKQMIEARLMNEQDIDIEEMFDDLESEDELDARMSFDDEPKFDTSDDVETVSMSLDDEGAPVVTTSADQDQDNPPYVQIDAAGDVNVELEFDDDDDDDEKEVITGAEVLEMKSTFKHVIKASNALYQRSNRRLNLKEAKKIAKSARSLKSSVTNYASKGILTNDPAFMQSLQEAFVTLSKTQNNLELFMKRRTNRLLEEKDMKR